MSTEFLLMATAFIGFLAAVLSLFVAVWQSLKTIKNEVKVVHMAINSRLDEMLSLTRKSAHANGVADEKERASDHKNAVD